jgi:PAS domain S-box-containing protein
MRDEHRPKQDLINEVVALRKQVADLKEASVVRWRIEQALRRSEEKYRELVELAPGGLCRMDAEGMLEQANQVISELLGCQSQTEALDFVATFGLFEDEREEHELFDALRHGGAVHNFAARLRRSGGGSVPVFLSGRALHADDAVSGYVLLVMADTTCEELSAKG